MRSGTLRKTLSPGPVRELVYRIIIQKDLEEIRALCLLTSNWSDAMMKSLIVPGSSEP